MGVATAEEALEQLRTSTFDCMVLDLSLPDASGYALLETLSQEDAYSFPPVIVYTGRDLSADDEQRLRRYSRSIIIKGAKSPERLLDEVTLFLHQVVSELPAEQQKMIRKAILEGRRILIVEDDVRNVYALTNILEPRGARIEIARNGQEALDALERAKADHALAIDLILMDVMMPVMDGLTATRKIRENQKWKTLPIITLTAKAMPDDQSPCERGIISGRSWHSLHMGWLGTRSGAFRPGQTIIWRSRWTLKSCYRSCVFGCPGENFQCLKKPKTLRSSCFWRRCINGITMISGTMRRPRSNGACGKRLSKWASAASPRSKTACFTTLRCWGGCWAI